MEEHHTGSIKIIALLLAAVISVFFLTRLSTSPALHQRELDSLEKKRVNITRLTAAATGASVAVSLLPDDTATPIAEKLADMTDYFLIALCAVYLEKYLITLTGYAAFGILLPLAFLLLAVYVKKRDYRLAYFAKKMIALGLILVLILPVSVAISDTIENTYQFSMEDAIENTESLESEASSQASNGENEKTGFFDGLVDTTEELLGGAINKTKELLHKGEKILNELMEVLAVLLVTSVIIPILILFFFLWIIRLFTNTSIPAPYPGHQIHVTRKVLKPLKKRHNPDSF